MSLDLGWLWNLLTQIAQSITSWFSNVWSAAQNIVNTGQGIFSGLVSFGSIIWDAITKAFNTLGSWFYNAFKWIYDGVTYWADIFGQWFSHAFQWIGSGLNWIAQQIWSFGQWIYNGLTYVWNLIVNVFTGVWNAITQFFSGIASAIGSWWSGVVGGLNSWFSNLIVGIRRKLIQTIIADVSIYFGWKSMERLTHASGLKEAGLSVLGLLGAPFVGYLFGNMINGIIPSPSTTPIQLIPEIPPFTYIPPSLVIGLPTERPYPELGTPPSAPPLTTERGLPYDVTPNISLKYDATISTCDKTASITTTIDTTLQTDFSASITSTIEYEVV
jgi:hypothetical protein